MSTTLCLLYYVILIKDTEANNAHVVPAVLTGITDIVAEGGNVVALRVHDALTVVVAVHFQVAFQGKNAVAPQDKGLFS